MSLVDLVFGCWHKKFSFPMTARGRRSASAAASMTGTYVVCLDCGKEFPYDWQEMKVITSTRHERRDSKVTVIPETARSLAKTA